MLDRLYEFNYVPNKTFVTELEVKDFESGEMIKVVGPRIHAETVESAQAHLKSKGINYIRVIGEYIHEYDTKELVETDLDTTPAVEKDTE